MRTRMVEHNEIINGLDSNCCEYDKILDILDFPLESVEGDDKDWDASNNQDLGPIPLDDFMGFYQTHIGNESVNKAPRPNHNALIRIESEQKEQVDCVATGHRNGALPIVILPASNAFQTPSPISVLESSGTCSSGKSLPIRFEMVIPVRARSKRGRTSNVNPWFLKTPIACAVANKSSSNIKGNPKPPIKNPPAPLHRPPITRQFAEKQNEAPFTIYQSPSESESKDIIIGDAEDFRPHDDEPVPMFIQHTEAMLQEIDRMDSEVDMEDATEEDDTVIDIDSADKTNPLAVVEYIDDLYAYYKKSESSSCVQPEYMTHQFDINERMRGILIDWLIEVHYKFELMDETLYLTVNLIDRFLAIQTMVRKKLQLVGLTAMLLACKYEEVSVPVVEDLILISDKAYTRKEVLDMERLMVNSLKFNLSVPTPYVFMRRFLKAAQADRKMELLSFFLMDLCLVEYEMLKFSPSLMAAAAIFTAQSTLTGLRQWSKTCEKHTNYTDFQLLECSRLMVTFHQKAGTGKLTGVHRKYSTSKYGYVAKTGAAHFLLDDDEDDCLG